jgi:DNA invertase Pin-like site-specific DNA recombinase
MAMAKIGYIRVSSIEQKTDRQMDLFSKLGLNKIFQEKVSGKNTDRLQLQKMLEYIREGDTLYIESLSRLGRSTKDLINIVEELNNKKVQLVSLKENIDTITPAGKLTFTIFASLAEFERECIKERQREGIESARGKGKHLGRPKAVYPDKWESTYKEWKNGNITAVQAFTKLNMPKATFYKMVKQYEQ